MLLFIFRYFLGLGLGIETGGSALALARARGALARHIRAHQNPTLQAVSYHLVYIISSITESRV